MEKQPCSHVHTEAKQDTNGIHLPRRVHERYYGTDDLHHQSIAMAFCFSELQVFVDGRRVLAPCDAYLTFLLELCDPHCQGHVKTMRKCVRTLRRFDITRQRMILLASPTMKRKDPLTAVPIFALVRPCTLTVLSIDVPTIPPTFPTPPIWSYTLVLMAMATFCQGLGKIEDE